MVRQPERIARVMRHIKVDCFDKQHGNGYVSVLIMMGHVNQIRNYTGLAGSPVPVIQVGTPQGFVNTGTGLEVYSGYHVQPVTIEAVRKGQHQWQIGEKTELWYGTGWVIGSILAIKAHTLVIAINGQAAQTLKGFVLGGGAINSRPLAPADKLSHSWKPSFAQGDPVEILKKDSLQWVSAVVQRHDVRSHVIEAAFLDRSTSVIPLEIVRPVLSWNSDTDEWFVRLCSSGAATNTLQSSWPETPTANANVERSVAVSSQQADYKTADYECEGPESTGGINLQHSCFDLPQSESANASNKTYNAENEKCIQSSSTIDLLPKKRKLQHQDQGGVGNGVVQENDTERHIAKILPRTTGSGLSDDLSIISKQENTGAIPSKGKKAESPPRQDLDRSGQEKQPSSSLHENFDIAMNPPQCQKPDVNDRSDPVNDIVCRICGGGGKLLDCGTCPAAFHLSCLGLDSEPTEKWVCGPCACQVCGKPDFTGEGFDDYTILFCDHCNAQYHVGCHRLRFKSETKELPSGDWFCSPICETVFTKLNKILGRPRSVSLERGKTLYTFQILHGNGCIDAILGDKTKKNTPEHLDSLREALRLLKSNFEHLQDERSGVNILELCVSGSHKHGIGDYSGFYTAIIRVKDSGRIRNRNLGPVVSVVCFRVFGDDFAELPFIATHVNFRKKGLCTNLFRHLQTVLGDAGVKRICLPAVTDRQDLWKRKFGFEPCTPDDLVRMARHSFLSFPDSIFYKKELTKPGNEDSGNPSN